MTPQTKSFNKNQMKYPKVSQVKVGNSYRLKDKANNRFVTEIRDNKFSRSEINMIQFTLELARLSADLR